MHLWSLVKDGLRANVATATPVSAIIGTFFAFDSEQNTFFAVSIHQPLYSTPLHGLPLVHGSQILPDVAQGESPFTAFVMSKTLSTVLSGKQSILSQGVLGKKSPPPMKEQEQALVAALAGQTLWVAHSGARSLGPSPRLDVDKVRRVLEGKAVVQIVDVNVEPRKEVGRTVSRDACSV